MRPPPKINRTDLLARETRRLECDTRPTELTMLPGQDYVMAAPVEYLTEYLNKFSDDWILPTSTVLIFLVAFISDFSYYVIDQGMRLFFYAVLVRIWTKMGSGLPMASKRNTAHVEFIVNAIGAVIIGYFIETSVSSITNDMIAAQSLALAAVISRLYVNMQDSGSSSLKDIIGYDRAVDRYLVLVPCSVAFVAPILVYHSEITLTFETSQSFFGLVGGSVLAGLSLHMYEKE